MHRLTAFFFVARKENMNPKVLPPQFYNKPYQLPPRYCKDIAPMFGNINPCTKEMVEKQDPRSCPKQQWKMFCATNSTYPLCNKPFKEERMEQEMQELQIGIKKCNGKYNNICGEPTSSSTCAVTIPPKFGGIYSR